MNKFFTATCLGLALFTGGTAWSGGILSTHHDAVQKGMRQHIEELIELNGNGKYPMFDPETRSLVQLEFKRLHDSVELKGRTNQYFVSCADFVAPDGTLYDLDFFLTMKHGVVSVLIHAKDGKETPYDVH
jgi:hypothetical protein